MAGHLQVYFPATPQKPEYWEAIPLSEKGFFAWKIPIRRGVQTLTLQFEAESIQNTQQEPISHTISLNGVPPLTVLPSLPLALHEETLLPAHDVWLYFPDNLIERHAGHDILTVACSASIDAKISFTIPGLMENHCYRYRQSLTLPISLIQEKIIFCELIGHKLEYQHKAIIRREFLLKSFLSFFQTNGMFAMLKIRNRSIISLFSLTYVMMIRC